MMYEIIKALHIASFVVFIGGMFSVAVFLGALVDSNQDERSVGMTRAVRLWDQRVTTPAMILTWAFGLTMALQAGWFTSSWLQIKLILVLVLSGLHGVQSGRMRRLATGDVSILSKHPATRLPIIIIACLIIVAFLAVLKPA